MLLLGLSRTLGPSMASFKKIGTGIGATVVLIGAWVGIKSFSGKNLGEECRAGSDSDCKGMSAQCLFSKAGNYCSKECNVDKDCPSSWACDTIGVTEIDAKGNMEHKESSLRMCLRGSASSEPASKGPPAASAPASTTTVATGGVAPASPPAAEPGASAASAATTATAKRTGTAAAVAKPKTAATTAASGKPKPK